MFRHQNLHRKKRKAVSVVELLDERALPSAAAAPVHSPAGAPAVASGVHGLVVPVVLSSEVPAFATTTGGLSTGAGAFTGLDTFGIGNGLGTGWGIHRTPDGAAPLY
jgi:hypothetical protein